MVLISTYPLKTICSFVCNTYVTTVWFTSLLFIISSKCYAHPKNGSCTNWCLPVMPKAAWKSSSFAVDPDWLPFKSILRLLINLKRLHPTTYHFVLKSQTFAERFFRLGQPWTYKCCSLLASDDRIASHNKGWFFKTNEIWINSCYTFI